MHVRHANIIGRIIQKVNATDVVIVERQTINNDVLSLVFKRQKVKFSEEKLI